MAKKINQDALDRAVKLFDESRQSHDDFVRKVESRYKTYRGILDQKSEAAQWTSKSHPPYIMHIVETTMASLVEDHIRYRISPRPSIDALLEPGAQEKAVQGAKAHQILFDWQIEGDEFSDFQRPFMLQNAIAGLTVAKTYWTTRSERRRKLMPVEEFGVTRFEESTDLTVVYDGPTTEVRDVRDFFWTPNATSLENSPWIIDRVWKLPEEIWEGFKDGGPFGSNRGGWSEEQCRKLIGKEGDQETEELVSREQELWNIERTKGLVEVWEVWDRTKKTVTTIANKKVLLSHREGFPFFHDDYPFVICSTQPDLFLLPGVSQVEKVAHLQTLLWDVANQSIDNMRLVNNAIFMFRPDVEDVDAYPFYPGARWLVEDPAQVQMWSPNPLPAEVSIGREGLIKGDMQNLAGGFPFSSGTDSQFVDQKTATGASIVSSIAQKSMDLAKRELYKAIRKIGKQRMILNQQFIREPQVAPVLGLDNEQQLEVIMPELLQGDFDFKMEPIPDSLMKQEEQASAQALIQLALSAFPVVAAAAQNGAATPLNLDAFMEDMLKAFGKEQTDRYFSKQAPAMLPGAGGGGGGPMAPPGSEGQPMGITGPQSIDPAVSPGAQISEAPSTLMQRAQAMSRGGAQNI